MRKIKLFIGRCSEYEQRHLERRLRQDANRRLMMLFAVVESLRSSKVKLQDDANEEF